MTYKLNVEYGPSGWQSRYAQPISLLNLLREITFRAWDGKKMYYPEAHLGRQPVMKSTGFEDANSKIIYEGDILRFYAKTKEPRFPLNLVYWDEKRGRWMLEVVGQSDDRYRWLPLDHTRVALIGEPVDRSDGYYSVVGNIFEGVTTREVRGA